MYYLRFANIFKLNIWKVNFGTTFIIGLCKCSKSSFYQNKNDNLPFVTHTHTHVWQNFCYCYLLEFRAFVYVLDRNWISDHKLGIQIHEYMHNTIEIILQIFQNSSEWSHFLGNIWKFYVVKLRKKVINILNFHLHVALDSFYYHYSEHISCFP